MNLSLWKKSQDRFHTVLFWGIFANPRKAKDRKGVSNEKNSIKYTRINGEVQRELSRIISREIKDPRIAPMTSVVDAVVTSDLKQCKAYISVLGNQEAKDKTMEGLNSALGYIRRELAHTVNLRNTPEIQFILDDSIEYGVEMSKKIDDLQK